MARDYESDGDDLAMDDDFDAEDDADLLRDQAEMEEAVLQDFLNSANDGGEEPTDEEKESAREAIEASRDYVHEVLTGHKRARVQHVDVGTADDVKQKKSVMSKEQLARKYPFLDEWKRPPLSPGLLAAASGRNLAFVDGAKAEAAAAEYVDFMVVSVDKKVQNNQPYIRLHGLTADRHSVTCHVRGFNDYLYVATPKLLAATAGGDNEQVRANAAEYYTPQVLNALKDRLNDRLTKEFRATLKPWQMHGNMSNMEVPRVVKIELVFKTPLMGYHGPLTKLPEDRPLNDSDMRKYPMLKITAETPNGIRKIKDAFEQGKALEGFLEFGQSLQTYEANIGYEMRYMVDNHVAGGVWVRVPLRRSAMTPEQLAACDELIDDDDTPHGELVPPMLRKSSAQIELRAHYLHVRALDPKIAEHGSIAPVRFLSVDIECLGRDGHFPKPSYDEELLDRYMKNQRSLSAEQVEELVTRGGDPVIQIANIVQEHGSKEPMAKVMFMLGSCDPIEGATVYSFDDERELLLRWVQFVHHTDPDVLTGYNIVNFDVRYLMQRAATLGILDQFSQLSRIRGFRSNLKDTQFSSKARGTSRQKRAIIPGLLQFDAFEVVKMEEKFPVLKLGYVAQEILGDTKDDVHHSLIPVLQRGTDADRKVLAEYCLKDALLPIQILEKKLIMFKYTEMCRVCSVPYSYLIERGQQVKVVAQILREAKPRGYVMDTLMVKHAGDGKVAYQGATVLEPSRGSYENIGVEDFQSLYPSTMIAHNLCYTTFLKNAEEREVFMKNNPEAYEISPIGAAFVRKERMEGLLPRILINLLDARAAAKKDLKNEKDPARKNVLDGRQNALKVSANSVYGFTGALVGFLPCLEISASVTSFGREQLLFTKKFIEDYFTAEKLGEIFGRPFKRGAKIIYGDTDSVFVDWGIETLEEAEKLGFMAAKLVSEKLPAPNLLQFEKTFVEFIMIGKKFYDGVKVMAGTGHFDMDAKGIQRVRRDGSGLVSALQHEVSCELFDMDARIAINEFIDDRKSKREGPQAMRPLRKKKERVERAVAAVKRVLVALKTGEVDLSELIISKSLSKDPDGYKGALQPHMALALRMNKQDPDTAPKVGDRVYYVITAAGDKKTKKRDRVFTPMEVIDQRLQPEIDHYITQIKKHLGMIMVPVMGQAKFDAIFSSTDVLHIKKNLPAFTGSKKGGSILAFAKRVPQCIKCKAIIGKVSPAAAAVAAPPAPPPVRPKPAAADSAADADARKKRGGVSVALLAKLRGANKATGAPPPPPQQQNPIPAETARKDADGDVVMETVPSDRLVRRVSEVKSRISAVRKNRCKEDDIVKPHPITDIVTDQSMCDDCMNKDFESVLESMYSRFEAIQLEIEDMLEKCRDCQKDRWEKVTCSNHDCEYYYRRYMKRQKRERLMVDIESCVLQAEKRLSIAAHG